MKEATGEVSMTMVTIVAVAVIGGILAIMWPNISNWINSSFGNTGRNQCEAQPNCTWNEQTGCVCNGG